VLEVVNLAKAAGGDIVGVGIIVDRTGGKIDLGGVRVESVIAIETESFEAENCPICKTGLPLVKPGSRK
jgi:orotate phosphoribosyltransferase